LPLASCLRPLEPSLDAWIESDALPEAVDPALDAVDFARLEENQVRQAWEKAWMVGKVGVHRGDVDGAGLESRLHAGNMSRAQAELGHERNGIKLLPSTALSGAQAGGDRRIS